MKVLLLFFVAVSGGNHWIKLKDSNRVHKYWVNHYGNLIGSYYLPLKPTFQPRPVAVPYTAQCLQGEPVEFMTEFEAVHYVEACPE